MGLESVFLSVRPMVLSLARSTIPSSTTLFSNSRKVQRAYPLGGLEHASAISLASLSPSKIGGTAGIARCLRFNTASSFHVPLQSPSAHPRTLAQEKYRCSGHRP